MKAGDYYAAAKLFKETIDVEPEYVDAYYAIGKIYLRKSFMNLASVKRYFRKVIELCPAYDIYIYYDLGDIYLGDEKYDSAYYYMSEFIKDPDKIKKTEDYNHADSVVTYTKTMKQLKSKAVPFNPVYVKGISTSADEYLPLISPDNEMAFFVRKMKKEKSKNDGPGTPSDNYQEKFMYSERNINGDFDVGNEMPYPFNTNENQGAASITIDNKTLYFVFCDYIKKTGYYNCDICESERKNGSWSEIKNLGTKVNGENTWESQPSISSDGKTLYFISDRSGGYGGYDIYKTEKDTGGKWSVPENLGPNINSSGNEKTPFIHTDNQTLYFSSNGWPGLGGYDIFYAKKEPNGKFGKPKNIGYPINTEADDVGFIVSTDGHYGYFASNKYSGPGGWDIYNFDLYPEARPDTVLFIKGNVKDEQSDEPVKAKVELKNVETKQVTEIPVDSATGKYVIATLLRNDYILTVKKEDYAYTSKYISKEDSVISKEPTKVKVDFEIKPIQVGQAYRLNDIYFAYGKYYLTEDSKRIIDGFIDFLNDHPSMKVAIFGHTDNTSDADLNLKLSENRAKEVYDYILMKGVDVSRLSYKGFGLTKPIASNDTEQGRAKNRRTEFVIIEK
jgi:outer membrane protein OmpA-like peptidoglycan-associated protein